MGGHIERLLGTLLRALHELPGATFSNPQQRGSYDSEAKAVMTLGELERWLTEYIVGVYHAKRHRGIGTSPLERWTAGVFGDERGSGTGVIDRPTNEERIRLDFLPFVERTVQAYGIAIDGIHYYSDVLRRFVGRDRERAPTLVSLSARSARYQQRVFLGSGVAAVFNDPLPQHDVSADEHLGAARAAAQAAGDGTFPRR
jgi:hypothetical protein